jgi:hypothetical protein
MSVKCYKIKQPIVIEAIRYDGANEKEISNFVGKVICGVTGGITIALAETTEINVGDYIIKHNGEFYPCKPEIFATSYEEI